MIRPTVRVAGATETGSHARPAPWPESLPAHLQDPLSDRLFPMPKPIGSVTAACWSVVAWESCPRRERILLGGSWNRALFNSRRRDYDYRSRQSMMCHLLLGWFPIPERMRRTLAASGGFSGVAALR